MNTLTAIPPGACIFADTMAEMTYPEVEAAIARGAIGLWALGVIEQHGPHLPTATDVYIPTARLREVKRCLAQHGVEALIIPPFYWGVNHVSASFPATIKVSPAVMKALMLDVMQSLSDDGMRHLFCVSGHNDRAHNATLFDAVCSGAEHRPLQASFVAETAMIRRLGVEGEHPHAIGFAIASDVPPSPYLDIHAGDWETSVMLAYQPDVVRQALLPTLPATDLMAADLDIWRQGHDAAKQVTPAGYFGDPAAATAAHGVAQIALEAQAICAQILQRLHADTSLSSEPL